MRISLKQLKSLIVETKSGVKLGKISDVVFETEGQNVLQYEVGGLIGRKYLINRNQVIAIDSEKMLVEDNVEKIDNNIDIEKQSGGRIDVEPAMMRTED